MKTVIAPVGGLLGAMLGGVLWAKYIQWTGHTAGFIAVGIGLFTGAGMLFTSNWRGCKDTLESSKEDRVPSKQPWQLVGIGAAVFAIVGIFIGKYLDVQWNAVAQVAEQLREQRVLSVEQAIPIAETVVKGQSVWELMRSRMSGIDLLYAGAAAFIAFRIPTTERIRNLFS